MTYMPSESMIIFKVETEGIAFSDLKGGQIEMVHAYKENAPKGEPNFYTDKVGCTKTTKNGEGDNIGYFYVNLADNLANKGAEIKTNVILNGNTNWKNNERSWIAFMLEANQLPTTNDYKVNVLGLCSADPTQFIKADGSYSAGMIRDYINQYIDDVTTSISDVKLDNEVNISVNGNFISSNGTDYLGAYSSAGVLVAESNSGRLSLSAGIYIIKVKSENSERTFKVAIK